MTHAPEKESSLKERLYEAISRKVISNEYSPHGLITESGLVREFEVSRAPVREALIQLCNEGILRNIPRTGYQVVQLSPKDIGDAIHTRVVLETAAAEAALERIGPEQLAGLEQVLARAEEARSARNVSPEQWWEINSEFHLVLARYSGNSLLAEMIIKTLSILRRAIAQYFHDREPEEYLRFNTRSHAEIFDALQAADREALVRRIREDILTLRELFHVR